MDRLWKKCVKIVYILRELSSDVSFLLHLISLNKLAVMYNKINEILLERKIWWKQLVEYARPLYPAF